MIESAPLVFKIASSEDEFEQIHRLNYKTFVEEIPQHEDDPSGRLVDKFHDENTYIICLQNNKLLGMVAVRGRRPFSLDEKLVDLDTYLPEGRSVCEIRLLSVEKVGRGRQIFYGLLKEVTQYCLSQDYDLGVISGTTRQLKLYKHLGFVPFGPEVGTDKARYQPMYLSLEKYKRNALDFFRTSLQNLDKQPIVNLLPGPVNINHKVFQVFSDTPTSHRSDQFMRDFAELKSLLCDFTRAAHVEILMGSGSLSNDVVAAHLALLAEKGLMLSNGEFGDRIIDHARRAGLEFEEIRLNWGEIYDYDEIAARLDRAPGIRWVWAVHCETSSGVLNALETLKRICRARELKLCLDCISSLGTVPVDLQGIYLASGVSGKGLGSLPGLSMVFYNHALEPAPHRLPRYFDLGYYASKNGVPFTISSNLVYALKKAMDNIEPEVRFEKIASFSRRLREEMEKMNFRILTPWEHSSPAVISIELPAGLNSEEIGRRLEETGFFLSYKSEYLLRRNVIQVCLMGEFTEKVLEPFLEALRKVSGRIPVSEPS
ncbi:MAG: aminotransferase class V-fold PLP-dependent enzyme [Acidobacteria bacterium]|nr:aminotransferase class V-fold PLP-dependent enzyme [Acidobacteriota bacterium]